jgi:hypothetical protein
MPDDACQIFDPKILIVAIAQNIASTLLIGKVLAELADRPASEGPARLLPAGQLYPVSFACASRPSPSCPALPEKPAEYLTMALSPRLSGPLWHDRTYVSLASSSNPLHKRPRTGRCSRRNRRLTASARMKGRGPRPGTVADPDGVQLNGGVPATIAADALLGLLLPFWRLVLGVVIAIFVVGAAVRLARRGRSRMNTAIVVSFGLMLGVVLLGVLSYLSG